MWGRRRGAGHDSHASKHCLCVRVCDASRLPNLVDIDLRGVKLEPRLQQAYLGGTDSLLAELKDRDTRTELQLKLERRLREGVRFMQHCV